MDPKHDTPASTPTRAAEKWFGKALAEANAVERRILDVALHQRTVAKDAALQADAQRSFGERLATLIATQQEQIALLQRLVEARSTDGR